MDRYDLRVRLAFAGTPETSLPALRAIAASGHDLVAVVTRPDAPSGRGRSLVASPVAEWAVEHGIETLKPERAGDDDFLDRLRALRPDCCPVVAYGALLPRRTLDVPEHGWVNLHFSVLPAWRGAAPVQHAVLAGDEVSGATTFSIVPELDAGPVYGVLTETVRPDDTTGSLLGRLADAGAGLLVDTLDHIEAGDIEPRPQPDGHTYAPKVEVDDARVRWADPAVAVDRRIRACTPDPGAWTTLQGTRIKLGPVDMNVTGEALPPGTIETLKHEVRVGTSTAPVRLGEVQPRGKRPMPAADWARGVRLPVGARFDAEG